MVDGGWRNFLIVKVTTNDGVVGWGDGTLGWKEFAVESLVKEFADRYLIGTRPVPDRGPVVPPLPGRAQHRPGHVRGDGRTRDRALGHRRQGLPASRWSTWSAGVLRDRIRVYANGWYADIHDHGKLRERVRKVVGMGYTAMKFDPFGAGGREMSRADLRARRDGGRGGARRGGAGRRPPDRVPRPLLGRHRDRGDQGDAALSSRCSARSRSRPTTSTRRPGSPRRPPPSARASRPASTPIRASASTRLLHKQAAHVIQPDLVYSGGFMETKKIAAMAEAHYVVGRPAQLRRPRPADGLASISAPTSRTSSSSRPSPTSTCPGGRTW